MRGAGRPRSKTRRKPAPSWLPGVRWSTPVLSHVGPGWKLTWRSEWPLEACPRRAGCRRLSSEGLGRERTLPALWAHGLPTRPLSAQGFAEILGLGHSCPPRGGRTPRFPQTGGQLGAGVQLQRGTAQAGVGQEEGSPGREDGFLEEAMGRRAEDRVPCGPPGWRVACSTPTVLSRPVQARREPPSGGPPGPGPPPGACVFCGLSQPVWHP